MHDRLEFPEPVRLDGANEHEVLFEFRLTTPLKLRRDVTVIVEPPAWSAGTDTLVGFADIAKSWMMYVTFAVWCRLPLVPVTVTL